MEKSFPLCGKIANFFSIVENNRGVQGDMNRKFAEAPKTSDRDAAVVELIKELINFLEDKVAEQEAG